MPQRRRTARSAPIRRGALVTGLLGGVLLVAAVLRRRRRLSAGAAEDDLEIEDQSTTDGAGRVVAGHASSPGQPGPGGLGDAEPPQSGRPGPGGLGAVVNRPPSDDTNRAVSGPSATLPSATYEVPPGQRSAVPINPVNRPGRWRAPHPGRARPARRQPRPST